jgi:hypothetical protein
LNTLQLVFIVQSYYPDISKMLVEEKESTYRLLRDEDDDDLTEKTAKRHFSFSWLTKIYLNVFLAISCCLNGLKPTDFGKLTALTMNVALLTVLIAHLTDNLMLPWKDDTKYNTGNYTEQDLLWGKLRADSGVIALTKSYAAEHGLRSGSPFPWDSEKEIYLINGFHSIHCVVSEYSIT